MKKLSMDMLEGVSGGLMTESSELYLDERIGEIKKKYKNKADLINYMMENYDQIIDPDQKLEKEEVLVYIDSYWDLL